MRGSSPGPLFVYTPSHGITRVAFVQNSITHCCGLALATSNISRIVFALGLLPTQLPLAMPTPRYKQWVGGSLPHFVDTFVCQLFSCDGYGIFQLLQESAMLESGWRI